MEKFYISFSGETLPGCDPDAAKQGLANFFKLDPGVDLDTFFTGQKYILKRNLERDTATRIYLALRKLGLLTRIEREAAARPRKPGKISPAEALQRLVKIKPGAAKQTPSAPAGKARTAAGKNPPPSATRTQPQAKRPLPAARPAKPGSRRGDSAKSPVELPGIRKATGAELAARARAAEAFHRDPGRIIKAVPAGPPEEHVVQIKKQAGEPNYFDLRLADGAFKEHEVVEDHFSQPAKLGAAVILLAFILVALRFWADTLLAPAAGLGMVAVDSNGRPAVVVNDQVLRHDRAGNPGELMDVSSLGLTPATPIDFFSNGDLLVRFLPSGDDIPRWLHAFLGVEARPGRLARCGLRDTDCRLLLNPLEDAAFTVDRRTDSILVAEVGENRILKLEGDGTVQAIRAIALETPVSMSLHDGMVYLTQGDSVVALRAEDRDFGDEAGRHTLAVEGAQATGHIFPRATTWLEDHWWVLMESRDGSTAGMYRFTSDWQYVDRTALPPNAMPGAPVRWGSKLLVPDARNEKVYRVASDNTVEKPFSDVAITRALAERRDELEFSRSLQVVVLLLMLFSAIALYTFGTIKSLQGKIYKALSDTDEQGFDISNEDILWIDPAPKATRKLRHLYVLFGLLAVLSLAGAVAAGAGIGIIVALVLLIAGVTGYCYAIQQSWDCHMGLLEDELVVVDHNNAYRIGRGPKIQYVNNYVMIDDVVVYLGNRLVQQFDPKPMKHRFAPIVRRGIRVDRMTLRLKLINSRHPMFYGTVGMLLSAMAALLLVILA